jgi:hypothetical protein
MSASELENAAIFPMPERETSGRLNLAPIRNRLDEVMRQAFVAGESNPDDMEAMLKAALLSSADVPALLAEIAGLYALLDGKTGGARRIGFSIN